MNEQRRVLKCRDFSAGRARELLLQRGITNGQLARAINCHPKSIAAIVNGRVEYRRGRLYERLRRHLISNRCADVVQQIDMVTLRNRRGDVVSPGEIKTKRRTVQVRYTR